MNIIDKLERGGGQPGLGNAIELAAKRIGSEEEVLHAILEVESGGDPFDQKGRLIILPEKHIFWRYLPQKWRNTARLRGLATPRWSRSNYKGLGGKGSDARWQRMRKMAELDQNAALMSASYGGPQIMGFNYKVCGFSTVTEFVLALAATEDAQDAAFIRFLEGVGLAQDLRERDFRAIARRYNGSGQVTRYAGMMQAAYQRLKGSSGPVSTKRANTLRIGSQGYRVKALQDRLIELGYHLVSDGDFGPATRRVVVAFQIDHGLKPDGVVGTNTQGALDTAVAINDQPGGTRETMKIADLRERGSQTIKSADRLTSVGGVAAATGAAATTLESLTGVDLGGVSTLLIEIRSLTDPLIAFVGDNKWMVLIAIGAAVLYVARQIKQRRLHDAKEWRHVG